jgi:peptide/nickel transport system substrate-binding protein
MLARAGIKVNLLAQPKAQYFAKILKAGNYNTSFYLLGWTPGTFDGHNVLFDIQGCRDNPQSSRGESNVGNYCNKEHDALTDKVLGENDKAKRDALMKEAFKIAFDEYAYIPLHQQALAWGVSKKVKLTQRADNSCCSTGPARSKRIPSVANGSRARPGRRPGLSFCARSAALPVGDD